MKKEVQAKFEKGEAKVVALLPEGAFASINIVEIEYGIDDRVIGFAAFSDENIWFRRKLHDTKFKWNGYTYDLNDFMRV